jgi:hypothetical protein
MHGACHQRMQLRGIATLYGPRQDHTPVGKSVRLSGSHLASRAVAPVKSGCQVGASRMTDALTRCPHCEGSGRETCKECGGTGRMRCVRCRGTTRLFEATQLGFSTCPDCNSLGDARCPYCVGGRRTWACATCNGSGWLS